MFRKSAISACAAASLTIIPAQQASADLGDALVGAAVGGVVGGVIVDQVHKKKQAEARANTRRTTKTYNSGYKRKASYNSVQRQENRDVQTSLNHFNFPAGTPDGVFGRNTRSAMSSYQSFMGYPQTGQLTEFERTVLVNSYHRSIAGGAGTSEIIANSQYGQRGLLKHTQQEMAGGTSATVASYQAANVQAGTNPAFAAFSLPNFGKASDTSSIANHCNQVNLVTNTNGGYTKASDITDPAFALSEQFCLARIYAIAKSEDLSSKVTGISSSDMQAQCETLSPSFKDQISALSLIGRDEVISQTGAKVLSTGMSPAQLSNTANICLGVGYRTDNADVALASTLILVTLGQPAYGELLGHHLVNGFGTLQRNDLALQWYTSANDAIASGQPAVFAPTQVERPDLIQAAALKLDATQAPEAVTKSTATFSLPVFTAQ
ncbi:peptidoglycan-binding domain-containing protein [Amylibacter sp. SFDW26]|uniref:peptidoglycan-binding domain-containing protein n=1 Tax=Amylibacter sp. SFDW26 TaxID=2652722 RepID=UPI001869CDFB|nr:peptidoglycan-binding domain-containing protein [Amylibacter sp. SFDW26]